MDPSPEDRLLSEPEPESNGASTVARAGSMAAGGALAALLASIPAALRIGSGESAGRALAAWLVLSAVLAPLAVGAVVVLARARAGLRIVAGGRAQLLAISLVWWSVAMFALLSLFGALLRKTTHHHALAGVTFAVFAAASGALVAALMLRAVTILARRGSDAHRVGVGLAGGGVLVALILFGLRVSGGADIHAGATIVDVLAIAIASIIASSRALAQARPAALAGIPAAVLLVVVGLAALRSDEPLRGAVGESAPVHAFVLGRLGR